MSHQRRVYRSDGHGGLVLRAEPLPALGPADVRIAVSAIALNFRDLGAVRGTAARPATPDRIPCSDAVGIVEAVGAGVTRVGVGDRVAATVLPGWIAGPISLAAFEGGLGSPTRDGVLADVCVIEETALVRIPAYLSDAEAATLPCAGLTAWHAVIGIAAARPGATVAIETTGGVALFALQFAVAAGLRPIVVARSDDKLARAGALGAWQVINSRMTPDWDAQVIDLTDGQGADLVIDMGIRGGLPRSCRAAAHEGTVAIVGVIDGRMTEFDIVPVMNKNLRVRGVETGSRTMFEQMNRMLESQPIHPVIGELVPFAEAARAFDLMAGGVFGKVVIVT